MLRHSTLPPQSSLLLSGASGRTDGVEEVLGLRAAHGPDDDEVLDPRRDGRVDLVHRTRVVHLLRVCLPAWGMKWISSAVGTRYEWARI